MKKIIALVTALIFAALAAAGCAGETKNVPASSDEPRRAPDDGFFGPVKIAEGIEDVYVKVETSFVSVYKASDLEEPSQQFPTSGFDDVNNSARAIVTDDMNSDGYSDLTIPFRRMNDMQYYYVYLYAPESDSFTLFPEMSKIGNLTATDEGYLVGYSSEHGATKYYFVDGELLDEAQTDESLATAISYAKGYLGDDDLTADFIRDELVDMALCRLYLVTRSGENVAYVAVSYDLTRVFYSELSGVYFDLEYDGENFTRGVGNYSKMEYTGNISGYESKGHEALGAAGREYYDMIGERLSEFAPIDFESPDAVEAMSAYMHDDPVWYCCFTPKIEGSSVTGRYYYTWATYEDDISSEVLRTEMDKYSARIGEIVGEMPTGLEAKERYVYLAEKLRYLAEEEHHKESTDGFALEIPGETVDERIAKTFAYMCKKADIYCTWDGNYNTIMDGDTERTVSVYSTFRIVPGSDEWFDAFYVEDRK